MRSTRAVIWLSLVSAIAPPADAGPMPRTIYVNEALTTGGDSGVSWPDAFRGRLGLQAALASIAPDEQVEIWIAAGTYAPAPAAGNRDASFIVRSGTALLGGFKGGESSADDRDPSANPTVLTGDLNSDDPPEPDALSNFQENTRHVVRFVGADPTAILDGVTIRSGYADSGETFSPRGGNIFVDGGTPTIRGCIVERGRTEWAGAGLAAFNSAAPLVEDCVFRFNRYANYGGGVANIQGSATWLVRCVFEFNVASAGAAVYNGPIRFDLAEPPALVHMEECELRHNGTAQTSGAGVGLFDQSGAATVDRCRFIGNTTVGGGGGVYLANSAARLTDCEFVGNVGQGDGGGGAFIGTVFESPVVRTPTFTNCRFNGNNGAMVAIGAPVRLVNCTLANNGEGFEFIWPTLFASQGGEITLHNCIVFHNVPFLFKGFEPFLTGGPFHIDRCDIEGWNATQPGAHVIAADPRYVSLAGSDGVLGNIDDDLRIGAASPCIDAGDNLLLPPGVVTDGAGEPRFVDDPGMPDVGTGASPLVDLGAHEFQGATPPCFGDADGDRVINFADITAALGNWGTSGPLGDANHDQVVNFADITATLSLWAGPCESL